MEILDNANSAEVLGDVSAFEAPLASEVVVDVAAVSGNESDAATVVVDLLSSEIGNVAIGKPFARLQRPPRRQPVRMSQILGAEKMAEIREEARQASQEARQRVNRPPEQVRRTRFAYYISR